jgi:hypothetical protein
MLVRIQSNCPAAWLKPHETRKFICLLIAACVTHSTSAAWVKLSYLAAVTKHFNAE